MPKVTEEREIISIVEKCRQTPLRGGDYQRRGASQYFGREHPLRDNINELIRAADGVAGKERITF
jgi:hypothetical protein